MFLCKIEEELNNADCVMSHSSYSWTSRHDLIDSCWRSPLLTRTAAGCRIFLATFDIAAFTKFRSVVLSQIGEVLLSISSKNELFPTFRTFQNHCIKTISHLSPGLLRLLGSLPVRNYQRELTFSGQPPLRPIYIFYNQPHDVALRYCPEQLVISLLRLKNWIKYL